MTTALRDAALALGVTPLPARISIANTHAPRPWAPFAAGWATAPVHYLGGGTTPDLAAIAYPADDPIHFEVCR